MSEIEIEPISGNAKEKNSKPRPKPPRKKRASGLDALANLYANGAKQLRKAAGEAFAEGNEERAKQLREWSEVSDDIAKGVSE